MSAVAVACSTVSSSSNHNLSSLKLSRYVFSPWRLKGITLLSWLRIQCLGLSMVHSANISRFEELVRIAKEVGETFSKCGECVSLSGLAKHINLYLDPGTAEDFKELAREYLRSLGIKEEPRVYAVYLRKGQGCEVLYVGESSSLYDRMGKLVTFDHPFSWELYKRFSEWRLGRSEIGNDEANRLWYDKRELTREFLTRFFNDLCIKWKTINVFDERELRFIEASLIILLDPREPHKKRSRFPLPLIGFH